MGVTHKITERALKWYLSKPDISMGPEIWELIKRCPPLDSNSRYCYLLQCLHFSATSIVAMDSRGEVIGFISGYLIPERPFTLFIWQVAVDPRFRGAGLGTEMLMGILLRKSCQSVSSIETTITLANKPSWSLFKKFADQLNCQSQVSSLFDQRTHFDSEHESEMLIHIGPFDAI